MNRRLAGRRTLALAVATVTAISVDAWSVEVLPDHPRLLIRKDELPMLRERARTTHAWEYSRMRQWADVQIELGGRVDSVTLGLLYQITGDEKYLEKITSDWAGGGEYHGTLASGNLQRGGVSPAVYDLVFEGLEPKVAVERAAVLFERARGSKKNRDSFSHSINSFPVQGQHLLAALGDGGDGVDGAKSAELLGKLEKTFDEYRAFHRELGGRRGGWMTGFFCGCVRTYPPFLEHWRNTTGENHWGDGMMMVGMNAHQLYFRIPFEGILERQSNIRGTETCSKYGTWRYAGRAQDGFAVWVMNHPEEIIGRGKDLGPTGDLAELGKRWKGVFKSLGQYKETYPSVGDDPSAMWERFLYRDPSVEERSPSALSTTGLHEALGLVSMRSSWKDDAIFATFKCGSWEHGEPGQLDDNTFSIHRLGTLVKRNGGSGKVGAHSVSHNTILVHDPDEKIMEGPYVGTMGIVKSRASALNDGGQSFWKQGQLAMRDRGRIIAFESNDRFDYVAGDATRSYTPKKMKAFTRQFVYVKPDCFVVFDRVESTKPDLKKTWVLHTKSEPVVEGDLITLDAEELGYNSPVYQWYTSRAFSRPEYENEKTDWERVSGADYKTDLFRQAIHTKVPNRTCRMRMLIPADGAQLALLHNVGPEYGEARWSVDGGKWKGRIDQHGELRRFFVRKVLVESLPAGEHEITLVAPEARMNIGMFLLRLGGRLYARTLLPERYERTWQFGFGTKFDTDEARFSDNYASRPHSRYGGHRDYRIDISPPEAKAKDLFLHVFQAATRRTPEMIPVKLVREDGRVGAELTIRGKAVTVTFNTDGRVGGHIKYPGVDRDLVSKIVDRDEPALVATQKRVQAMEFFDYPVADVAPLASADDAQLFGKLGDLRWHVRFYAARLLARRGTRSAAKRLATLVLDADPRVAAAAAEALGRLGAKEHAGALITALSAKSPDVRLAAAAALGSLKAESASGSLAGLLSDSDPLVAAAASRALGCLGKAASRSLLGALGRRTAPEAQVAALRALAATGERTAIRPARRLALSLDAGVRAAALRALVALNGNRASGALRRALGDSEVRIRFYAARELQRLKDNSGTGALVETLEDDRALPLDRVEAARLLGLSGDTEAAPALKRMSASRVKFPYPNGKLDLPKECGLALKKLTTGAQ